MKGDTCLKQHKAYHHHYKECYEAVSQSVKSLDLALGSTATSAVLDARQIQSSSMGLINRFGVQRFVCYPFPAPGVCLFVYGKRWLVTLHSQKKSKAPFSLHLFATLCSTVHCFNEVLSVTGSHIHTSNVASKNSLTFSLEIRGSHSSWCTAER